MEGHNKPNVYHIMSTEYDSKNMSKVCTFMNMFIGESSISDARHILSEGSCKMIE